MVESAGPGTRPRSGGLTSALPLSSIVVTEIVAIALYAVLRVVGVAQMPSAAAALAVGVIGAALATSTRGFISVWGRLRRRIRFVRRRVGESDDPPMPFDVPTTDRTLMGLRWVDGRLISVIRLSRPVAPSILSPTQTVVSGSGLKLGVVARALRQFDIELESIDVVAHGWRTRSASHVAGPYQSLTGSLPAVPEQDVWIVLRLNPLQCPDAIASRGGGSTGVIRTAITATRRVGNHLAREGYRTRILTAGEITAMTGRLLDGAPVDSAEEDWDEVRYGSYRASAWAVPGALDAQILTDIWSTTALSTTTSTTITHDGPDEFELSTVVRYGSVGDLQLAVPDGLESLAGQQEPAISASVPAHRPRVRRMPVSVGDLAALDATVVPDGGCGQLIGADQAGSAVAVPLFGPDVRRVDLYGDPYLMLQIAVRAIALGARILVRTDRPETWRALSEGVNDARTLFISANATDQRYPTNTYTVCLLDSRQATEDQTITTHIRVHRETGEVTPLGETADVAVYQDASSTSRIYLVTSSGAMALTLVSVPAENHLIEGLRAPRPPVPVSATPQRPQDRFDDPRSGSVPPHGDQGPRRPAPFTSGPGPGGPGPNGPGPGGPGLRPQGPYAPGPGFDRPQQMPPTRDMPAPVRPEPRDDGPPTDRHSRIGRHSNPPPGRHSNPPDDA
ncbi:type VII secretion protein EccE [Williamsia herbipolensis]|uniref:Type VII secretion protein EccE n=1 Tax=Williamsia herbipolensis TaxID=1603258 RepID=A0AAU4K0M4_9NOCA|nr:type VII secretion protein EccE [Williamsia herbipolensis]